MTKETQDTILLIGLCAIQGLFWRLLGLSLFSWQWWAAVAFVSITVAVLRWSLRRVVIEMIDNLRVKK